MRTSLNEIAEIDKYVFDELSLENKLLFQAKVSLDSSLRLRVLLQKKIYTLLAIYHRKKLKEQAEAVFVRLMNNPKKTEFRNEISSIFKNNNL